MRCRVFGKKNWVCKEVVVLFPIKILGIKSKGREHAHELVISVVNTPLKYNFSTN